MHIELLPAIVETEIGCVLLTTEAGEEFAHFAGGVGVALRPRLFDAGSERRPRLFDAFETNELLRGHEEGRNMRRMVLHQVGEGLEAAVMISLIVQFHRQTIEQKRVIGIVRQHRFDFLPT